MGRGNHKGSQARPCALDHISPKTLKAIETEHQVKNLSGLIRALDAMGMPFKTMSKGKGKGKNNNKDPNAPKRVFVCPHCNVSIEMKHLSLFYQQEM